MSKRFSRRDFLKLSGLAMTSLAFAPLFPRQEEHDLGKLVRVTVEEIDLRAAPRDDAEIVGKRYRDQLVHIYAELNPPDAPQYYNTLWYRVWGGYLHSAYLQPVKKQLNQPVNSISEAGKLFEVTIPYTTAYQYSTWDGWQPWRGTRLYYETVHWATGIDVGPDGKAWYQITSELSKLEKYFVPATHLRIIAPDEIAPIAEDVPPEQKKIEVSISEQKMWAYENGVLVREADVSTGIPNPRLSKGELPTATPRGRFRIQAKLPNKHMGSITGNPDNDDGGFSLPGVPWTCFFEPNGGYAFHGTYWHNNFGLQMSHGCINMRNEDAKWLFRWTTPVYDTEIEDYSDWHAIGYGTQVVIE